MSSEVVSCVRILQLPGRFQMSTQPAIALSPGALLNVTCWISFLFMAWRLSHLSSVLHTAGSQMSLGRGLPFCCATHRRLDTGSKFFHKLNTSKLELLASGFPAASQMFRFMA